MLTQAHIYVKGDVTRVGYRGWLRMYARQHAIAGWARNVHNKPDIYGPHGGVEVLIQGEENTLQDMIYSMKDGSPTSRVDDVEVRFEDPTETLSDFEILKDESFSHYE